MCVRSTKTSKFILVVGRFKFDRNGYATSLVVDLSSTDIVVPEQKFDCMPFNSCFIETVDPVLNHDCQLFGTDAVWKGCLKAKTILRSKQRTKVPKDHAEVFWLDVWLVGKNRPSIDAEQNWALGDVGIIGLSPKSAYWEYLRRNFDHGVGDFGIVSLAYQTTGAENMPNQVVHELSSVQKFLHNSLISINGKLNPGIPDFWMPTDITKDHWSFVDIQLKVDPNMTSSYMTSKLNLIYGENFLKADAPETTIVLRGQNVTISTSKLFFLGLKPATYKIALNFIAEKVCNGSLDTCTRQNMQELSTAPIFKITT
jgi:hypothetical protein